MSKKMIIAISCVLLLTGCFGAGEIEDDAAWIRQEFATFTINIPPGWNRIDRSRLSTAVPASTVAVYVSPMQAGFLKTIVVNRETLNTEALSYDYARSNITLASRALPDYREIAVEDREIGGIRTMLHAYMARNTVTDSLMHFTQAYFSKDATGYTVTCALPDNASEADRTLCRRAVSSFRLK